MKKNTSKVTFCAMMAALAAVFMLLSYFPYLTYAIPAIAGLFIMVALIETNAKWALLSYISSAVLVFLFAESESKLMYICFLGYYPILKAIIERLKSRVLEWVIKILSFNAAVLLVYYVFAALFGISLDDLNFMKYGAVMLLALGNIVFVIYDIMVSKMAATYIIKMHPRVSKMIK